MKLLGFAGKPLALGVGAMLTGGIERPVESTTTELMGEGPACLAEGGVASRNARPGDGGEARFSLSPLQRMIEEILDPAALLKRPMKEWRGLYKAFFAVFAPNGGADETERKAWGIAAEVFNTNLVAVCNRTSQVVPMTFQDFVDGIDSFRHDGLREGAQRDIAWQPKKILVLMAAMTGRILAGWQADARWEGEGRQGRLSFREHLIAENRKAGFLGAVFDYDPRFSILEYRAAGLKPVVHAFPHFAQALMENGIDRCEFCAAEAAGNPPLLRAHFRRPLRVPSPLRAISTLHLVLLHKPLLLPSGSQRSEAASSYFEYSRTTLEALAFEPAEAPEIKCSRIERLFELAISEGLLICAPHRADASTATRFSRILGRTQAEQFVIERFFALGFRSGHGNEPWLEQPARQLPELDPSKVKKARKEFGQWKDTSLFFLQAGQPQAADLPGARMRREALQPKGSDLFLSLLKTAVYAPLMGIFLATDAQGRWRVDEPELHAFARALSGTAGRVLLEKSGVIAHCADSFQDREAKGRFLFECAVGILLSATNGHQSARRLATYDNAKGALRRDYERLFAVSLSAAPSALRAHPADGATQWVEMRKRFEEAEQTIVRLLGEPLSRKVSAPLRPALATLLNQPGSPGEQTVPRIQLESQTAFEESITRLCSCIELARNPAPGASLSGASQMYAALVEVRTLAEGDHAAEALEKARVLYPALSKTKKQSLAPFFGELSGAVVGVIEEQLDRGNIEKATALAESTRAIVEGMPTQEQFQSLLQELLASKGANKALASVGPSTAPPAPVTPGPRAKQAEVLLGDYADELSLAENQLEQEFLNAVREGTDAAFKRKGKLRNRLQKRTRWGGREPYRTALKLLEAVTDCNT